MNMSSLTTVRRSSLSRHFTSIARRSVVLLPRQQCLEISHHAFSVPVRPIMSSPTVQSAQVQATLKTVGKMTVNDVNDESRAKSNSRTDQGQGLTVDVRDGIRRITLDRPHKKNALTNAMYGVLTETLREANEDDATNIVVMTGSGDYFCSGNDLGNFANVTDVKSMAESALVTFKDFVASYIDLRKPLIVLVNGPAVGIGVTVLALADSVYASDKATFVTPFSSLGQSPEACSSYLFPRIMGYPKATEMLLFNAKITAQQAVESGLVTQVFLDQYFPTETQKRVQAFSELPVKSLVHSKELVRGRERKLLHHVNEMECGRLLERLQSKDCLDALARFFSRRK